MAFAAALFAWPLSLPLGSRNNASSDHATQDVLDILPLPDEQLGLAYAGHETQRLLVRFVTETPALLML